MSNLILNMGKKIDVAKITIKGLLDSGVSPAEIIKEYKNKAEFRHLKLTFQKLYYLANHDFKTEIKRRNKLNEEEVNLIVEMAKDKTTSEMSSRKIANEINNKFEAEGRIDSKGKQFKISKSTICKYLNKQLGKPRKLRKVFALNEKKKKKELIIAKI